MIRLEKKSFTIVEMMLVLGIVSMLLVVAVPSLIRSRIVANEVAAIANCQVLWNGCMLYYYNSSPHDLPENLALLGPAAVSPAYIDNMLANANNAPEKQGYRFTYTKLTGSEFAVNADPITSGSTGSRHFYIDQTGYVRVNATDTASETDPLLQE